MKRAFTLLELLVTLGIIAVLAGILLPVISNVRASSARTLSANSLRQLAAAGRLYLGDHDNVFWPYSEFTSDGGTQWWYGWESNQSRFGLPEGQRILDLSRGPLGPYTIAAGGMKTDPALPRFRPQLKPKYRDGNYGYGYNTLLVGKNALTYQQPSQIVMFATCAQVNTFQTPATAANPMVEEFYMVSDTETTVHFRHGGKALVAFLDGSVRSVEPDRSTLDSRMPSAMIGRFAPVGSKYLLDE